ncbi:CDP-glycerol glycerophosphotransferase family protein [Microbacterium sp. bgisy189]|uniref:CDP-glycerol glycerophosphotransferase family protein n=1 Tax=Microbacterium sp. bgisy189 TaxID=3413798 RepID=UPI003EBD6785
MIDKLIEGRLLTLLVGSVFRLVEIVVRAIHLGVRGVRIFVQENLTARADARLSVVGKRLVARRTRRDPASIVLLSRDGEYGGDVKYIAEELLRRRSPYRITWALRERSVGPFPRAFSFVRLGTAASVRAIASANVVVQDGDWLQRHHIARSDGQHWLTADGERVEHAGTSDSVPPAARGHARNDVLVSTTPQDAPAVRKKVTDRLGIADAEQRFLLFAPSSDRGLREAQFSGIDFASIRAALARTFGGEWEILIRTDAVDKAHADLLLAGLPSFCHDATFHPDLQELLVVSDAGMTDRAEWIADYLLTRRPAFLFDPRQRELPAAVAATPLAVSTSNRELVDRIEQFDAPAYDRAIAAYLRAYGEPEDGAVAAHIVDRIDALMGVR